jgi:hypothetical protein
VLGGVGGLKLSLMVGVPCSLFLGIGVLAVAVAVAVAGR